MKKIIYVITSVLVFGGIYSCSEPDNAVYKVQDAVSQEGGALRTIAPITSPNIELGSPTAGFAVNVEIQDTQNGNGTEKIDVYATFKDNSPSNGSNPRAEVLIKSVLSSSFVQGPRELLKAAISVTAAELQSKLGLTVSQYTGGDQFVIRLAQVLKNGSVFTNSNSNPIFFSGFFSSPFIYNANVVCPITQSLAGTHTYVSTNMRRGPSAAGVACGGTITGSVTWTATATPGEYTTSDHSFGMFGGSCWSDTPATSASAKVTWFCNKLVAGGTDQYGDSYTYTITAVATDKITLNWISTYNDRGTVVLTRQGGAAWPSIIAP